MEDCLAILKYSLNPNAEDIQNIESLDWQKIYRFANKQAIMGVIFEGVSRLSEKGVKPPSHLLLRWIAISEQIEKRNRQLNQNIIALTTEFRRKQGDRFLFHK